MQSWDPISTAPQDFTRVLVCDPTGFVTIAKCLNGWWYDDFNRTLSWQRPLRWMELPNAWRTNESAEV